MTRLEGNIRAFIALQIPQTSRLVLNETIRSLKERVPDGVRWVDPSGIHLTLKFLGNVTPAQVEEVLEAMHWPATSVAPFQINLYGLGTFPNEKRPRVVWAGIQGELDSLMELQEKLEKATGGLGFARERRPFSPHLTLGRVKEQVPDSVRRRIGIGLGSKSLEPGEPWLVEAVYLVRSQLAPSGATYSNLGLARLGTAQLDLGVVGLLPGETQET